MVKRGQFIEWAVVHGAHYGTSRKELKKGEKSDLILDIDVQGARQVKENVHDAVFIFVLPPSFGALKKRLRARRLDSLEAVRERLARAREEVKEFRRFNFIVINDDLGDAAQELASIILCQRARLAARRAEIKPIVESFEKG
jgi:guanylate kinase